MGLFVILQFNRISACQFPHLFINGPWTRGAGFAAGKIDRDYNPGVSLARALSDWTGGILVCAFWLESLGMIGFLDDTRHTRRTHDADRLVMGGSRFWWIKLAAS